MFQRVRVLKQMKQSSKLCFWTDRINELNKEVHVALKNFDRVFLAGKPFIIGEEPSVADLFAYNEIIQMDLIAGVHRNAEKYPNIVPWLNRMSRLPGHKEMYQSIQSMAPSSKL